MECVLHLASHQRQELWEVDGAVAICINLVSHVLRLFQLYGLRLLYGPASLIISFRLFFNCMAPTRASVLLRVVLQSGNMMQLILMQYRS